MFPHFPDWNLHFRAGLVLSQGAANGGWARPELEAEVLTMLIWVLAFLVIAVIAAILRFGVTGASVQIAQALFFVVVVLFVVSVVVTVCRALAAASHGG